MNDLSLLIPAAVFLGFSHTILGLDHYLPFIVMSKAGKWSSKRTFWVTFFSGIAHVSSSFLLGLIGFYFGTAVNKLINWESVRGNWAAWGLIAFGLIYFVWGLRKASRKRTGGSIQYLDQANPEGQFDLKPWIIFTIFIFGPCEPLIPLLMYPAAQHSMHGMLMVAMIFGCVTVSTMLGVVMVSSFGLARISLGKFENYSHALAGFSILLCGLAIQFLGL